MAHAVLPVDLPDDELGVGENLDLSCLAFLGQTKSLEQSAVLCDVVRRAADRLAVRGKDMPVVGLQDVTVRSRPGIPARTAVGRESRFQLAVSICAFCSLPL